VAIPGLFMGGRLRELARRLQNSVDEAAAARARQLVGQGEAT